MSDNVSFELALLQQQSRQLESRLIDLEINRDVKIEPEPMDDSPRLFALPRGVMGGENLIVEGDVDEGVGNPAVDPTTVLEFKDTETVDFTVEDAGDGRAIVTAEADVSGNYKVLLPYQWSFTDDDTENIPASIPEYAHDPPNVAYLIPHFHRWGFAAKADKTTLFVGEGKWDRNGKPCIWAGTAELSLPAVTGWRYVIAKLIRDDDARDPSIEPNAVEVSVYDDPADPDGYPKDSIDLNPDGYAAYNRRNIIRVLGRVQLATDEETTLITSYEQWVFSDFDDESDIPDADHYCDTPEITPIRKTLSRNNNAASLHFLEWQLYDVDNPTARPHTGTEYYVPIFQDGGIDGGEVQGELRWFAPDATHNAFTWSRDSYTYLSLDAGVLGGEYECLFVYGFPDAEFCSVPYCDDVSLEGATDARSLVWRYPANGVESDDGMGNVTWSPYRDGTSLDIDIITDINAGEGGEFPPEEVDPETDILVGYCNLSWSSTRGKVQNGAWWIGEDGEDEERNVAVWLDPDRVLELRPLHHWLKPDIPPAIDDPDGGFDADGWAKNYDHDGRYVRPGVAHDDDVPSAWQSIGYYGDEGEGWGDGNYSAGVLRVELNTCELVAGSETPDYSVDWADYELRKAGAVRAKWGDGVLQSGSSGSEEVTVDWINRTLKLSSLATVDWNNCELAQISGSPASRTVTVDWANRHLHYDSDNVAVDWLDLVLRAVEGSWYTSLDWGSRALLSGETSYSSETGAWIVGDETFLHVLNETEGTDGFDEGALIVEGGLAVKGESWFGAKIGLSDLDGDPDDKGTIEVDVDGFLFDYLGTVGKLGWAGAFFRSGVGVIDGSGNEAQLLYETRATGWTAPAGTLARTDPDYAGQTVSASYTQSELQATDDAVKALSRIVAALITDLHASGSVHSLLDVSA